MALKNIALNLGKVLLCSLLFALGAVIGGMLVTLLGWQAPAMPEGVDGNRAFLILLLESPLLALTLILIGRGLRGGLASRSIALSFFTWVVYSLNTAIESLVFTDMGMEGALFTIVSFLLPSIFCGAGVAWFFPPEETGIGLLAMAKEHFASRSVGAWVWRLALSAVVFVPVYLLFGSLVAPLTAEYFRENMYGLRLPSQEVILLVLSVRSALFLLACLPIIVLWWRPRLSLVLTLGLALFMLVGFLYMLGAYYMPLAVRIPHTLEILADSFVHAGLLVGLLAKRKII